MARPKATAMLAEEKAHVLDLVEHGMHKDAALQVAKVSYRRFLVTMKQDALFAESWKKTVTDRGGCHGEKPVTRNERRVFLNTLREGVVTDENAAAAAAGRPLATFRALRKRDAEFAEAWEEVKYVRWQKIRTHAEKWAVEGVYDEQIVQRTGEIVEVRRRSERLAERLLEASDPESFAPHRMAPGQGMQVHVNLNFGAALSQGVTVDAQVVSQPALPAPEGDGEE